MIEFVNAKDREYVKHSGETAWLTHIIYKLHFFPHETETKLS